MKRRRPPPPWIWRRGGLSWRELAIRVWRQVWRDELTARAAQLAFHAFFALFPALLFLTALLGYVTAGNGEVQQLLLDYAAKVAPRGDVLGLVRETLAEVRLERGGGKLWIGLLVSLWVAATGMVVLSRALGRAFGVVDHHPWWRVRLTSAAITVVFGVGLAFGLLMVFRGEALFRGAAEGLGLGGLFRPAWTALQWLTLLVVPTAAFDSVYNLGPGHSGYRWRWWTPGAVLGVALWLGGSFLFRLYLETMARTFSYGSLGAVIVLLAWFYLTAFAVLIGGEINSEIWKAERARVIVPVL
jgi:membrane protein